MGRQKVSNANGAVYSDVKVMTRGEKFESNLVIRQKLIYFWIGPNKMVLRLANM